MDNITRKPAVTIYWFADDCPWGLHSAYTMDDYGNAVELSFGHYHPL